MSEIQSQSSEQPTGQTQPVQSEPAQSQPVSQPQPRHGFSGKQVVGIVLGVLALFAVGLALGGLIGFSLGQSVGAQRALVNRPAAQAPAPVPQTRRTPQAPRNFGVPLPQLPFGQQLPALNPGGPYLGVQFETITPALAAQEGITGTTGALIRDVVADSPAAKAGLKVGDVVSAVNGNAVNENNDLRSRVAQFKPNDEVTLTVVTGTANGPTNQHEVKVTLAEQPAGQFFNFQIPFGNDGLPALPFGNNGQPAQPQGTPAASGPYLGLQYEMITPAVAAREGITGTQGALIQAVMANSPAAQAGLNKGDVITAVDGKSIDNTNNLRAIVTAHKVGDELTLTVVKGTANGPTGQHEVKVTLAARPAEQNFQLPPGLQPGAPSLDSRSG